MYCDPNIVEAWNQADSGRGFAAGLKEKGYILAQGRKRLVVVDNYGHTHNPVRHLENVRSKQFNQRVADLDLSSLPDASLLSKSIQARLLNILRGSGEVHQGELLVSIASMSFFRVEPSA